MKIRRILVPLGVLLAALALVPGTLAANQNEKRLDVTLTPSVFTPVQAIADAAYTVRRYRTEFVVRVEDLDPGFYDVYVADVFRGQISVLQVAGGTEGILRFASRPTGNELPLGFDPRGKAIGIRTGLTEFFAGTLSTEQNPEAPDDPARFNNVRYRINALGGGFPPPRGTMLVKSSPGLAKMTFEFSRLPDDLLTINVNGIDVATFTPYARGIAKVRFSTDPSPKKAELLLDFDPANSLFQIKDGETVLLEFETPDKPIGGGAEPVGQAQTAFNNTGMEPGAFGSASLQDLGGSRFEFHVHVGGSLPPADYDLFVGGIKTTTIRVTVGSDGASGRVSFSTVRNDPTKLPLTFDPRGQTIQVSRASDTYLSMTFPN